MKKSALASLLFMSVIFASIAQEDDQGVVATFDELTVDWDNEEIKLKTYEGLHDYCKVQSYRAKIIGLLKDIHHYDSALYEIVQAKYSSNNDSEAKATLNDIAKLESEYTTRAFLNFGHKECRTFNNIEQHYSNKEDKGFRKEVKALEKELVKYVDMVTKQIDIIDEHIHHLKDL